MKEKNLLWIDDEIDLLKMHILYLKEKGHKVETASNGTDAIEMVRGQQFDLIFLDENMPGLGGLETLQELKQISPGTPVVMITKNEEEDIMEEAIGSKISDYLIKPVKPNQILLAIKKHTQNRQLITEKTTSNYQASFSKLSMEIGEARNFEDWSRIYRKLVHWEMELESTDNKQMDEILLMQKSEANNAFSRFIQKNYEGWFGKKMDDEDKPLLSPSIFRRKVAPLLEQGRKVAFIVVDNLRFDQWRTFRSLLEGDFRIEEEDIYCSILPTATHYARNAIFAGLMPGEIARLHPQLWNSELDEGSKNQYESELMGKQLDRLGLDKKFYYYKISNDRVGHNLVENLGNYLKNDLLVLVYNFIDILSHARTEMDMIRELASNAAAFRSLSKSWFQHSSLKLMFKALRDSDFDIVLTTDHGTIQVNHPVKVIGDRETTTNLRFKQGKNLHFNKKEVFAIRKPENVSLPGNNISSSFIFARNNDFLAYPNNYNYYVKYYKNTFQHGGVSLEEMLIPLVHLKPS